MNPSSKFSWSILFVMLCGGCVKTQELGSDCVGDNCSSATTALSGKKCRARREYTQFRIEDLLGSGKCMLPTSIPTMPASGSCTVHFVTPSVMADGSGGSLCDEHDYLTRADVLQYGDCIVRHVAAPTPGHAAELDGWYFEPSDCSDERGVNRHYPALKFTDGVVAADGTNVIINCQRTDSTDEAGNLVEVASSECMTLNDDTSQGVGSACKRTIGPVETGADIVAAEIGSTQCETGVCLTDARLTSCDGVTPIAALECEHSVAPTYCSCRCDAPVDDPGPHCTCPSGFTCSTVFEDAAPQVRGGYCIRDLQR